MKEDTDNMESVWERELSDTLRLTDADSDASFRQKLADIYGELVTLMSAAGANTWIDDDGYGFWLNVQTPDLSFDHAVRIGDTEMTPAELADRLLVAADAMLIGAMAATSKRKEKAE